MPLAREAARRRATKQATEMEAKWAELEHLNEKIAAAELERDSLAFIFGPLPIARIDRAEPKA